MTSSSSDLRSSKTDEGEDHNKRHPEAEAVPSRTAVKEDEDKDGTSLQGDGTACADGRGSRNTTLLHQSRQQEDESAVTSLAGSSEEQTKRDSEDGRERLKRHRNEVAGGVRIPEIWGQEDFLKEWMDCSVFDALLAPAGLLSARAALVRQGGRVVSSGKLQYS